MNQPVPCEDFAPPPSTHHASIYRVPAHRVPIRQPAASLAGLLPALLFCLMAVFSTITHSQQVAPTGTDFQINTFTTGDQQAPAVAGLPNGGFVVVWQSTGQDGSGTSLHGQLFDSAGSPMGGEFQVNTYTTGDQAEASVDMHSDGTFVVAYEQRTNYLYGRRYDAFGAPLDAPFLVQDNSSAQRRPTVAFSGDGTFVVAFDEPSTDRLWTRPFDSDGGPLSFGSIPIDRSTGAASDARIASHQGTTFTMVWQDESAQDGDGDGQGVSFFELDAQGDGQGMETLVNTYTTGNQGAPRIAETGGEWIVVWQSQDQVSGTDVFSQRFTADRSPVGDEVLVNSTTGGEQSAPDVAMGGDASSLVVFSSGGTAVGRSLAVDGTPLGTEEFVVAADQVGVQESPQVAPTLGGFVMVWVEDNLRDGSGRGIFARRLSADADGDGVADVDDNCPDNANPDQTDGDQDTFGAACDCDDDDDSVVFFDNCGVCGGDDSTCQLFKDGFESGTANQWSSSSP